MRKCRHGGCEVLEARDPRVDVTEHLPHLAHGVGQARVRLSVVVADHEEEHVAVRVRSKAIEDFRGLLLHPAAQRDRLLARRADQGQRVGVVVDEVRRAHAIPGRRLPPELATHGLALVPHAAREDVRVIPESAQELRKLRRMAERIGDVRDARGAPELAGAAEALLQVADDRFPGNEKEVSEDVPGTNEEAIGTDERFDSRAIALAFLEIVLDRDGLAVERE